jgi:hypothetical protein
VGAREAAATVVELSTRLGAVSPLPNVRIGATDRILGLSRPGRLGLATPGLYLLANKEGSKEARIRSVDLDRGEVWSSPLLPTIEELIRARAGFTSLPQPAVSDTSVVIAYSLDRQAVSSTQSGVECFDRANGRRASHFTLSKAMGRCDFLRFFPLGSVLLLQGENGMEVLK